MYVHGLTRNHFHENFRLRKKNKENTENEEKRKLIKIVDFYQLTEILKCIYTDQFF